MFTLTLIKIHCYKEFIRLYALSDLHCLSNHLPSQQCYNCVKTACPAEVVGTTLWR